MLSDMCSRVFLGFSRRVFSYMCPRSFHGSSERSRESERDIRKR